MDDVAFRERYRGRAVQRATRDGFLRNVCVALGNVGNLDDVEALKGALGDGAALVRGHAAWGLGEIARRHGGGGEMIEMLERRLAAEGDGWVGEEIERALVVVREHMRQSLEDGSVS
tara:strand:+ start:7120 stop:7470 length:351 start_codon:yes stop_codon:yes gene_type:complete